MPSVATKTKAELLRKAAETDPRYDARFSLYSTLRFNHAFEAARKVLRIEAIALLMHTDVGTLYKWKRGTQPQPHTFQRIDAAFIKILPKDWLKEDK